MRNEEYWNKIYEEKTDDEVSWTLKDPSTSLSLVEEVAPVGSRAVDVGAGTSVFAQRLLGAGYKVAVLDISAAAVDRMRERIGNQAKFVVADVTKIQDIGQFDVWHDRAVFHFLTSPEDRQKYVSLLKRTLRLGGYAVIVTFALDGPEQCSGLDVCRYDGPGLAIELGDGFELKKTVAEQHVTPGGNEQSFQYSLFQRT